jgi:hypothetical protein
VSCPGRHRAGCADGATVPVVPMVAFFGLAWVGEHLLEVAIVSCACGVLAVAAAALLIRWGEHCEARHAAQGSLWTAREAIVPARPTPYLQALQAPAPPAIVNNYGPQIHIYGRDGGEAAAQIIRQAIPGEGRGRRHGREMIMGLFSRRIDDGGQPGMRVPRVTYSTGPVGTCSEWPECVQIGQPKSRHRRSEGGRILRRDLSGHPPGGFCSFGYYLR